jgi:hypothetical protein
VRCRGTCIQVPALAPFIEPCALFPHHAPTCLQRASSRNTDAASCHHVLPSCLGLSPPEDWAFLVRPPAGIHETEGLASCDSPPEREGVCHLGARRPDSVCLVW